ncbi:FGGY-family carbohydrate kinase [Aeromicrobium sp. CTD01-1L150]|uniref:FGGY-family carbohydrate kinase n=1 Tax=Aeromicrobium sp. CTD01-1L150 TaxID=3341830 RepID=UPI0035C0293B
MSAPVHLGVDLGTQSVKVCAVDVDGTVLAMATRPLTSTRDGTRHEQDPHEWVTEATAATAEVVESLADGRRADVAGLAVCGTSGTLAVVDSHGTPVGPAVMYDDATAATEASEVSAADPERWRGLGYRIQPSWAVAAMVRAARVGLPAGARFAHQPDVVTAAMTGAATATDWSSALKSGYDLLELSWPEQTFAALGLPPALLPEVVAPGTVVGRVGRDWATATGVPPGTAVIAGMTDGCASQLGAGALGSGDWHAVIGTTLVLKGVTEQPLHDDSGAVYSHRSPEPGRWLPGGASSVGAGALTALLPGSDLTALSDRATEVWATGRLPRPAYPLTGAGERFPFVRPDAHGFALRDGHAVGLHDAGDEVTTYLAVVAGVACVERLCLDTLHQAGATTDGRYSVSGGATRSPLWNQLRADVLERTLVVSRSAEPAVGMAILAAAGTSGRPVAELARSMSDVSVVVEPDPGGTDRMLATYATLRAEWRERGWIA